jgi:hypothetical protein
MEPIKAPNLSLITKSHENKWVALSMDYKKLIASSESLVGLKKKIGQVKVIVMHVLPADVGYAPTIR